MARWWASSARRPLAKRHRPGRCVRGRTVRDHSRPRRRQSPLRPPTTPLHPTRPGVLLLRHRAHHPDPDDGWQQPPIDLPAPDDLETALMFIPVPVMEARPLGGAETNGLQDPPGPAWLRFPAAVPASATWRAAALAWGSRSLRCSDHAARQQSVARRMRRPDLGTLDVVPRPSTRPAGCCWTWPPRRLPISATSPPARFTTNRACSAPPSLRLASSFLATTSSTDSADNTDPY